jgi:hypothetical protein
LLSWQVDLHPARQLEQTKSPQSAQTIPRAWCLDRVHILAIPAFAILAASIASPSDAPSAPLRNAALRSPMPGGSLGGYFGDTGLDVLGRFMPVYAVADGVLEYSEWGHTLWRGQGDTPYSIRLRLDHPLTVGQHRVTHVYYTHLSAVVTLQPESSATKKHVAAGERIATSGIGNHVPHLHVGFLLDGQVEQDSWTFILREDAIRDVMGGYRTGERLP